MIGVQAVYYLSHTETLSSPKSNTIQEIHLNYVRNYLKWLEEKEIVAILLGESSHSELLRRSSPLFRFIFRNKSFPLDKIELIIKLVFEKHDTSRKQILKILADLAELMDYNELEHLFEKLSQVSVQEIDQDVLQLIKTIGNNVSITRTSATRKKRVRSNS